ncbi:pseudouridine synthase [Nocardia sp. CA-129566]|uniref:pseudouridine synthase n=1 Tax=Nocardia sp. CA-129566 TaxID=3239976 RepID=UPI003D95C144
MNTPARRDGTPDRRNRSDQPRRGGAGRSTRDARSAQRGGTQRGAEWGGSSHGGSGYRGSSQDSGGDRGYRGSSRDDGGYRGSARGSDYRGSSQGDQRSGGHRGTAQGGGYGAARGSADRRGSSQGGYRGSSQGESGYRGSSQGGSGYRGSSHGGSGDQRGSRGDAYRGAAQGGSASRATGSRGYTSGSAAQQGNPSRRPASAAMSAPVGKKAKAPKPQKKVVAAPLLSNAKPAKRQHVDQPAEGGHEKMPWGEGERLQKVLAKAGVASRRAAEEMIAQGRVEVDGAIVTEQGLRIDPQQAVVRVDGTRVMVREELVHLALNKPKGWQSTMSDDLGRPCVGDIVAERIAAGQRLFHVGRLDADTEGLLLLTNDGDLAHRLMHPSFQVEKTYLATVNGEVHKGIGKRLRDGVELEDGPAKVDKFQVLEINEGRSLVKIVLHEGRKHIVRRLLDAVGHPVTRLVRTNIGPIALGDQRPGTLRVIGRDEVGKLYEAVSL